MEDEPVDFEESQTPRIQSEMGGAGEEAGMAAVPEIEIERVEVKQTPLIEVDTIDPPAWTRSFRSDIMDMVAEATGQILATFERTLAYDRAKEDQLSRLHAELQQYKADLLAKTNRPFIMGFIRMHDDLAKVTQDLVKRGPGALTPEKVVELLAGFQEDIEIFLEQQSVTVYREQGKKFDGKRQTALRTTPTVDENMAGTVAASLRPGFEQGNTIVQKERVEVYALSKQTTGSQQPADQKASAEALTENGGTHNEQ